MTLANYTSTELIVPELQGSDAANVVSELSDVLERAGRIVDSRTLCSAVIRRESLSSTVCAPGWALPHGRLAGLSKLCFAFGRCARPISWFQAAQPVQIIFLFAVPDAEAAAYLNVVSGFARLNQDRVRASQLLSAPDPESLLSILRQIDLRARRPAARAAVLTS